MRRKKNNVRRSVTDVCPARSNGLHVVISKMTCSWTGTKIGTYCKLGSVQFVGGNYHTTVTFFSNERLLLSHCSACNRLVISRIYSKKGQDQGPSSFAVEVDAIENAKELELIQNLSRATRTFAVVLSLEADVLSVVVYVNKSVISVTSIYSSHGSEIVRYIVSVVSFFFPNQVTPLAPVSKEGKLNLMEFYQAVEDRQVLHLRYRINISNIVPALRPYQENAVRFMISRELEPSISFSFDEFLVHLSTSPPLWFCKATGGFSDVPFPAFSCPPGGVLADEMGLGKTVEFLALVMTHERKSTVCLDEEDGKTPDEVRVILNELVSTVVVAVEAPSSLACQGRTRNMMYYNEEVPVKKMKRLSSVQCPPVTITCIKCGLMCPQDRVHWNRFPSSRIAFRCPDCIQEEVQEGTVLPIKATLIIVPSMISLQWYEEVKRHTRNAIVDMYRGVIAEGYKHPEYLATKDVVICSLETLRSEVYFVEAYSKNTSLRRPRKERIAPTPLLAVQWWRLCVDEAQLVENSSQVVSNMCKRIAAVNRWCITGTPVGTSINDLYGLFAFLGIEPVCHYGWWSRVVVAAFLAGNTSPLIQLVSEVFWRTSKKQVMEQIASPHLTNEVTMLRFTPLEDQLYRHRLSVRRDHQLRFLEMRGFDRDMLLSDMFGSDFEQFMAQLNSVRAYIVLPVSPFVKSMQRLSSEEGMYEELSKITTRCIEEQQRTILFYCNAVSGIGWLTGDLESAALYYERALSSIRLLDKISEKLNLTERRGPFRKLRSDELQQIHAMNGIVDLFNLGIAVRNIDLEEAMTKLKRAEDSYLYGAVCRVRGEVALLSTILENLHCRNFAKESRMVVSWLCDAATSLENCSLQHVLIDAVCTAFANNDCSDIPMHSARGLNLVLVSRWDELTNRVCEAIQLTEDMLNGALLDDASAVDGIITCHYVDTSKSLRRCVLCVYDSKLKGLESLLFSGAPTMKQSSDTEMGTAGRQKVSSMEIAMRVVRNLMLRMPKIFTREAVQLADDTLSLIDCFKDFLQHGKQYFLELTEYAARRHEIVQCKLRLEYIVPKALEVKGESYVGMAADGRYVIRGQEKEMQMQFIASLKNAESVQTRLLGKLRYIANLRKERKVDCPVCMNPMKEGWMVLGCAHCLCYLCFNIIASGSEQMGSTSIRCPVCRETRSKVTVRDVHLAGPSNQLHHLDSPNVKLIYEVSVKLNAVLIRLLSIKEQNPFAKTIIFTSFTQLVPPICSMIADHNIPCRYLSQSNRQKVLAEFRQDGAVLVLVMPINLGARGLNLTVASNIIFIEPQMDASQVAQAIGRIDRIGQTRNMTIHHFVVRDSIEEQIYHNVYDLHKKKWTVGSVVDMLSHIDAPNLE